MTLKQKLNNIYEHRGEDQYFQIFTPSLYLYFQALYCN